MLQALLDIFLGARTWRVEDYGQGAAFVMGPDAPAPQPGGRQPVTYPGLRYRAACKLADRLRQEYRETPRPLL